MKVEAVQGKQVSLEWTETSGRLREWWHDPEVPLSFPVESAPSNLHGDWPLLRPPDRVPEVPVLSREPLRNSRKSRRFSPPGEMRPIFNEASRGLSHLTSGTPRVLHTLAATQEVPRHTRLHERGSTRVLPTSRGAPCLPASSRGGIPSLRGRERIPGVPVATQEEALSTGNAKVIPGSCNHSQSLPEVSVQSRETCLPCTALTFKPRIDSHNGGTWDSPEGKPRGKASRESH